MVILAVILPGWVTFPAVASGDLPAPNGYVVLFHPDDGLFVGDQVSFQILAPHGVNLDKKTFRVSFDQPNKITSLGSADFFLDGFGDQYQAILPWAWDTIRLAPGRYTFSFQINPAGLTWKQTITLAAPLPNQPHWVTTTSDCCTYYYISGTAVERDIAQIKSLADAQAKDVASRFNSTFKASIPLELMSRVLGHGGFTSDEIYVSYLDRNYASDQVQMVLHHEMVHLLDGQLGGDLRPTLLVEGLAVYLTGGHFKPEPLLPRAAALPGLGLYLPLPALADDFYVAQHEVGYLEGGALIAYMVNTWGWQGFSDFYRDIKPIANKPQSASIDAALRTHFNLSFSQLEEQFLNYLAQIPINPDLSSDVRLTVDYYEAMRRYQQVLDPSAYFRQAWLPDAKTMRQKNITADLVRHPDTADNQTIELLLINARQEMVAGNFDQAEQGIRVVNAVLSAIQKNSPNYMAVTPLSQEMAAVVQMLDQCGMEPQDVQLGQQTGQATVIITWPNLENTNLVKTSQGWQTQPACQPVPTPTKTNLFAAWQEWQYVAP